MMQDISKDEDLETGYKETFRVFSKDEEGCITAEEIMLVTLCLISGSFIFLYRFVLKHLPGQIKTTEIEEMIKTVDKNRDGKINYSEFRVRIRTSLVELMTLVCVLLGDAGSHSTGHPRQPSQASSQGGGEVGRRGCSVERCIMMFETMEK